MRRVDEEDIERYLMSAGAGSRVDLVVKQIAPWTQTGAAFVPIEAAQEPDVQRVLAGSPQMAGVLRVVRTDDFRSRDPEFFDALAPGVVALRVAIDSDRTLAGYGPIVATLRALALHTQDARFLMRDQADWLDDVRIEGGRVTIARWCGTEDYDDDTAAFDAVTGLCPGDAAWRSFAEAEHVKAAERELSRAAHASRAAADRRGFVEEARKHLAHLGDSAGGFAMAALADMLVGDMKAAAANGQKAEGDARAQFVLARIALRDGRTREAQAHAARATARATWMCEAHLIALATASGAAERVEHERALVRRAQAQATAYPGHLGGPWNDLRVAILLDAGLDASSEAELDDALIHAALTANGEEAKGASLLLFTWGEALRLRVVHAKSEEARRGIAGRARAFFEHAGKLDPLGGEVARRQAWLK